MTTWNGDNIARDLAELIATAIVLNDPDPDPQDPDADRRVTVEVSGFMWDRFTILARHVDGSEPRAGTRSA